ncbi:hypothetical protein C804_05057 [Lachnospiraceae bacterium A4]|jgi:hypothetical protein|nr:hypothetical protein C804_05057 [Lachnospiraceae bacterium A4]
MEHGKKKKMRTVIFDILILLCGAVLAVEIFLYTGTQHWMLLPLAAVVLCMALTLAGLVSSFRSGDIEKTECFEGEGPRQLILLNEQGKPVKAWSLEGKTSLIIGKSGKNQELDVDLLDCEYSSFVDFQHAALNFCMDQWYIEDLESHNGVKIKKVEDGECYRVLHRPCRVMAGDILYIANTTLLLT